MILPVKIIFCLPGPADNRYFFWFISGSSSVGSSLRNESTNQENNNSVVVINDGFTAGNERSRTRGESSGRAGDEYILLSEEEDQDTTGRDGVIAEWESQEDAVEQNEREESRFVLNYLYFSFDSSNECSITPILCVFWIF